MPTATRSRHDGAGGGLVAGVGGAPGDPDRRRGDGRQPSAAPPGNRPAWRLARPETGPEADAVSGAVSGKAGADAAGEATPVWLYALLFLLGNLWGLTFSLLKIALAGGGDPVGLALWQQAIGASLLLAVLIVRGRRVPLGWPFLRHALISGLVGVGVPSVVLYTTARHVPAGVMSMLMTTAPMITYGLALAIGLERLAPRRLIGIGLGLAGVLLILAPTSSLPGPDSAAWALLVLLAPVCYALNTIFTARFRPPATDSVALACGMLAGALFWQALYVLPFGEPFALWRGWSSAHTAVVALGAISATAFLLFFVLIQRGGPVFFSQVGYIVTVTGVVYGMAIFGETHSGWLWLSLVVLMVGIALVAPRRSPPPD